VFLLGQEVAPGTTLAAVSPDGVTLATGAGRQEVRMPPRPPVAVGGAPPAPAYTREGNTLSAPSAPPAAPRPVPVPPPSGLPVNPPPTQPAIAPPGRAMVPAAPPEPPAATGNPTASQ